MDGLVNAVYKEATQEVARYSLTPLEFNLLRICMERRESTATDLAEVLPVDASRISRVVTGLVDRGFIRRRRLREDRRIVMLRLSEEGEALMSRALLGMEQHDAMLTEGVGEEEMRAFVSVSQKVAANHAALRRAG